MIRRIVWEAIGLLGFVATIWGGLIYSLKPFAFMKVGLPLLHTAVINYRKCRERGRNPPAHRRVEAAPSHIHNRGSLEEQMMRLLEDRKR